MKFLFYLLSLVPKSLFEYLIDIYLSLGVYKYSSGFKVTSKNIEIAFPDRNKKDVALLAKRSFKESIISGYESIYTWGRNDAKVNSNILRIENNYLINNLKENGLIAVSFHNRSVDMLLTWMNSQHTTTSLFKKIKNKTLNSYVKHRIESVAKSVRGYQEEILFIGRQASASPATGISSRHNENQKNIINLAINADKKEIYENKDGVSLVKFKLPIE